MDALPLGYPARASTVITSPFRATSYSQVLAAGYARAGMDLMGRGGRRLPLSIDPRRSVSTVAGSRCNVLGEKCSVLIPYASIRLCRFLVRSWSSGLM